jgi:hypothetical protein
LLLRGDERPASMDTRLIRVSLVAGPKKAWFG